MRSKVIVPFVLSTCLLLGTAALAKDKGCPKPDKKATAVEVLDARMQAFFAGDIDRLMRFYAEDAVVVLPGSVVRGRDAIRQAFLAFGSAFGGVMPTITSVTSADDVVLADPLLITPGPSIPDGADTFVIRDGEIGTQTVHGTLVFPQP